MTRAELRRGLVVVGLMALFVSTYASGQSIRPVARCHDGFGEYEQVLDAHFAHACGDSKSAVVLRVYGGLIPEYELVLDPSDSSHSIFWYRPQKSIWGGAYDGFFAGKHRAMQDYISRALKIPFTKQEIEISEAQFPDLVARVATIDTSICEHFPLRDSKGNEQFIEDLDSFELIVDGGRTGAQVSDTGDFTYIVSQNPALLQWDTDIEKILRDHLR
jgi:hypothetical protein